MKQPTDEALNGYLSRLRAHFPEFVDFGDGDATLAHTERDYKVELVDRFRDQVEPHLRHLPENVTIRTDVGRKLTNLFIAKLHSTGEPQNLVGWRYFQPLMRLNAAELAQFATDVATLLYGPEDQGERVDHFVTNLNELVGKEAKASFKALSRSVASFLLMLSDPTQHVIIKTREFNRALKAFGAEPMPDRALTGSDYARVQTFLQRLRDGLRNRGLHPRDMIDVQTVIWVGDEKTYPPPDTRYWLLSANCDGLDMTSRFVEGARWDNCYPDYAIGLERVKSIKAGDRVAIKTVYKQTHGLPFNACGKTMSCMDVKAIGVVRDNHGDGLNLAVDWDDSFQGKTIYIFTYMKPVVRIDHVKYPKVVQWVFEDVEQPKEEIEAHLKDQTGSGESLDEDESNPAEATSMASTGLDAKAPENRIFYGPPGCGKTHRVLKEILPRYGPNVREVTFHPSMSYEEFIEGLRPVPGPDGHVSYAVMPGLFLEICEAARRSPDKQFAVLIDEINRANVSRVFGELMTLLETDKRLNRDGQGLTVRLTYSKTAFGVPANLDVFGTMNSADRSIALLDTALRRRFRFEEIGPDPALLENAWIEGVNLCTLLQTLNQRIEYLLDREHRLGHAYFMRNGTPISTLDELKSAFREQVIPLLMEYFHDDWERIALVLINREKGKSDFVQPRSLAVENLFGKDASATSSFEDMHAYALIEDFTSEMFQGLCR